MITFTDRAKQKVIEFLKDSPEGTALRVSIVHRTADGFTYNFGLEEYRAERPHDTTVREGGFATRIDMESSKYLKGAIVDWVETPNGAGFDVKNPNPPMPTGSAEELKEQIITALRTVFDPEIPVNIYDLGLIYNIDLTPTFDVTVRMTLTAPNCPAAEQLPADAEFKVKTVPGVGSVKIDLVWDPPWTKEMMSEVARLELNL